MSRTDLLADSFTIIRNAVLVKKDEVVIPHSVLLSKACAILKKEGYIDNFKEIEERSFKRIKVYLRYRNKKSVISQIKRVSRPGRRVYVKADDVPAVLKGYGIAIVSTSQGVFTDREAREKNVGGEILAMVW